MIDDKINRALTDLEANLKNVKSAKDQVKETVDAYQALVTRTTSYTENLSAVNDSVEKLIKAVENNYDKKVAEFDKDRNQIVTSCNQVIEEANQVIQDLKQSFEYNQQLLNRLKIFLVFNGLILVLMVLLHFLGGFTISF